MSDLLWLLPAIAIWAIALRRVLRDFARPTVVGAKLARCGLPPPRHCA